MAAAWQEQQVTWPSSGNSKSIAAGTTEVSDEMTVPAGAVMGYLQLKAKNDSTPSSGDTVDCKILNSLGDPDGASTDEFENTESARQVAQLDTNAADPDQVVVPIPVPKKFKIEMSSNAGVNGITGSATVQWLVVS